MSEAERLAIWCEENSSGIYRPAAEAAAELRRLSAELEALKKAMGEPVVFVPDSSIEWMQKAGPAGTIHTTLFKKPPSVRSTTPLYALTKDQS